MNKAAGARKNASSLALALATVISSGGGLAHAQSNAPPCPDSKLAPWGIAPDSHCAFNGCLVTFKGYKWWTAFQFNPDTGYFYNGGLGTTFAPEHVTQAANGDMILRMAKDWGNKPEWAGAEVVLMFNSDGTQANLGYGDYLVTAELTLPTTANWANYDPNVAFGLFTYERPATGTTNNRAREIDLAEISRWGWNHTSPATCPFSGRQGQFETSTLCLGNAQFALQDFTKKNGMVNRYDIREIRQVTLVMKWRPGEVVFEEYNGGGLTLSNLPAPAYRWKTPSSPPASDLSAYVPAPACQRFHINLWLGNYMGKGAYEPHDGPTNGAPVQVQIKDFQFKAYKPS
jgi:hypothetical protein